MELSLSHGIRSKVAAEYGEGNILIELSKLLEQYTQIYDDLRTATRSAWVVEERKQIYDLFNEVVDPSRINLQNILREKTCVKAIIKDLKNSIFCSKKSPNHAG